MRASRAVPALLALAAGCVYYNAIYNAQEAFQRGETLRRAGRHDMARAAYADVVRKAAAGYRKEPDGPWASEALYLLGRARLRLGEVEAAREALDEAAAQTTDEVLRHRILVYLALAEEQQGERERALQTVNEALRVLRDGPELAEGHLLRGRILLSEGHADTGWWDLDRAAEAHPAYRVDAALETLRWAVRYHRRERARQAIASLAAAGGDGVVLGRLEPVVHDAARAWGVTRAGELLAAADSAGWDREVRARLRLLRAEFAAAAGDTATARALARQVAEEAGEEGVRARVWLARLSLLSVRDLAGLGRVRAVLLPAQGAPAADTLLEALARTETLAGMGPDEPLAFFVAGEVARDRLRAPVLARGLFLAFADAAPDTPWAPKALLAALEVSPTEGDRAWIRGRLEPYRDNPYVLAARGVPAPGFETLEEELALLMRRFLQRSPAEPGNARRGP